MRKLSYQIILIALICSGNLLAGTYYVDDSNGNNSWDGTSPVYVNGNIGPFKTIRRGVQSAYNNNDTVMVANGIYCGEDNLELNFHGNFVTLKSDKGSQNCILDFQGYNHNWHFDTDVFISGFTFKGIKYENLSLYQQTKVVFDNCIFENNRPSGVNSLLKCSGQSSLKLNNCSFRGNVLDQGCIVKSFGSASLEIIGCQITENIGMYDYSIISCGEDSNIIINDTRIEDNWNYYEANIQGIDCRGNANVEINGCTINDNYSYGYFRGVNCENDVNIVISGCNISNNWAMRDVYGVYVGNGSTANLKIAGCVVSENTTNFSSESCAIKNRDCNSLQVVNCLITGNNSGVDNYGDGQSSIINCTIVANNIDHCICYAIRSKYQTIVNNCIVKDNGYGQIEKNVVVSYSDISDDTDHIWPGVGNINTDPLFADPNRDDYHLLSEAGRYDSANQRWVRDDVSSPCIDAGDPADWLGDEPAGSGGRINMGYFGGTSQASKADFCTSVMSGDINRDCLVNFIDFALMTSDWLSSTIEQP